MDALPHDFIESTIFQISELLCTKEVSSLASSSWNDSNVPVNGKDNLWWLEICLVPDSKTWKYRFTPCRTAKEFNVFSKIAQISFITFQTRHNLNWNKPLTQDQMASRLIPFALARLAYYPRLTLDPMDYSILNFQGRFFTKIMIEYGGLETMKFLKFYIFSGFLKVLHLWGLWPESFKDLALEFVKSNSFNQLTFIEGESLKNNTDVSFIICLIDRLVEGTLREETYVQLALHNAEEDQEMIRYYKGTPRNDRSLSAGVFNWRVHGMELEVSVEESVATCQASKV
ncbi:hypothetical protein L596_030937 [Steinernema carpocapsae]|uniref:Uncharacterized protein n=1 Tax=Steinernema carpocapsae TaxID=34508 RepID=A0A4U5MHE1_STECR|nr:hypothetical protein L596_030937 [Steinernema carpocapsae]